jgi:hypothetical protein
MLGGWAKLQGCLIVAKQADATAPEIPDRQVSRSVSSDSALGIESFEQLATADVLAQRLFGPPSGYRLADKPGLEATGQMELGCAAP